MTKDRPIRILYGVQATGQGHITRARVMAPALKKAGADVDFLFSGRPRNELYGMEPFGNFQDRRGMTFYYDRGRVNTIRTIFNNSASQLLRDIHSLDLAPYDLVITDYEPITAWAAKKAGKTSIGIGHQYAFLHDIPMDGFSALSLATMRYFAPADISLGVHWDHFGQPILPPIFEPPAENIPVDPRKILVYLNFEDVKDVTAMLKDIGDYDFYIYSSAVKEERDDGHLKFRPTSPKFKHDLETCAGIICGAGFELPTEVLHMGKKIMVKAMDGQPEQLSNALALGRIVEGSVIRRLETEAVRAWLENGKAAHITFPDTATALSEWIVRGKYDDTQPLIQGLWKQVRRPENC